MKASQVIKWLQTEVENYGDLNVRLICDHGQRLMSPNGCSMGYIEDESKWMSEEIHPHDIDEYPDATKVIVLEAS